MTLDIVTCFPFDWIYLLWASMQDDEPQTFRNTVLALRALRLGRALRLMAHQRVFTYLSHVFTRLKIRAAYTTILKRTVVTIIFAHCNCCVQFLLAHLEGLPADSWVVRAEIDNLPVSTQYMAS